MDGWRDYLREVQAHLEELRAMGITDLALPLETPSPPAVSSAPMGASPARTAPTPIPASPAVPLRSRGEGSGTVAVSEGVPATSGDLAALQIELAGCKLCRLCEQRRNVVFGVGNPHAALMFIGEGPGEDEDRTGEPFVGAAGQLLTKIIGAMGLTRNDVYIANVVKCRPPGNRTPFLDEVEQCYPFLRRQIELVNPKVLVTLGLSASQALLQVTIPISKLRGNFYKYGQIQVMPTYHPAYLLRTPAQKRAVWEDMQKVMAELGLEAPKGPA